MSPFLVSIIFILILVLLGIVSFFTHRRFQRQRFLKTLELRLLLIKIPQKTFLQEQKPDWKEEINRSGQLFSILLSLKDPFVFETAVHHIGENIYFYLAVPKKSLEFAKRQIEGLWNEAQVEEAADYNIFNPEGTASGFFLRQKNHYALPLRTYPEANLDTFTSILSGFSKINETGEGIALQIIVRPEADLMKKTISQIIENLKKGAKLEEVLKTKLIGLGDVQKALWPETKKEAEEKVIDEEAIKSLEMKIAKPLLLANYRIIASAPNQNQLNEILESVSGAFSQFSAPRRNELKVVKPHNPRKLIYQFSFREFNDSQTMILNTEELAGLFHLPTFTTEVPKIKWLKAKEAPPPLNLPTSGVLIGESVFRGERKPVYITEDDRRRHIYVVGQTGTGKSTLMINMVADDIQKGKGMAVIDPHGDLIETILGLIPKERAEETIVFDPSDINQPLGLNMLEYNFNRPEEKTFVVNELFNILDKLYNMKEVGGPMFEQYTKNAILLLMEDMPNEPATLMEVPRVFTDAEFRQRKLARIKNPVVIDFWEKEAAKATGEHSLASMTPYITSKFNNFIANDYVRPIIGQPKSTINFRQIMDEGKILLVNLSKGRIGDINAGLLGMIITGKILMAALSRVDLPQERRRDFNLYIDEFQNFTTDSISTILSEARKYRLNLVMAHQFIAQLTEKIRDTVFGNVGSMIVFRVGAPDTEFLIKQFEPIFSQNDLVNIDNFNAYLKLLIEGQTSKPFNIKTLPPKSGQEEITSKMKKLSRLQYGRSRQEVEGEILKRLRE